jgi:hypothetical protein
MLAPDDALITGLHELGGDGDTVCDLANAPFEHIIYPDIFRQALRRGGSIARRGVSGTTSICCGWS